MLNKLIIGSWVFLVSVLFLYSFVQVDLGLTLTRASFFQSIQQSFQYVGYFNRPLSAFLFCFIIVCLFVLYLCTLYFVYKKKVPVKTVWIVTFFASFVLLFSYSATSYDVFNYIFDAKIVTHYHQNPYFQKALDYPGDPMLGFMHWTHRTYPYGPTWLGLTVPLSFVGGGYFLITYYLFKLLVVGSYLLSCWLIYKIVQMSKVGNPIVSLTFFALNPLVIIETLVASHNDIPMISLALIGIYFLLKQKKYSSWLFLLLSIGVKFGTAVLLPVYLWYPFSKRKNKDMVLFFVCFFGMLIAVVAASQRTTFQPWYVLLCLPFAALLVKKSYIVLPVILFSFLVLFQYVPFFYSGNYDAPIPYIMNGMLVVSVCIAGISAVLGSIFFKRRP